MRIATYRTEELQLEFENTNLANIGDATGLRGSTTAGSFFANLHTAFPTSSGSYAAVCAYTGYTEVTVARSTAGWTVASGAVDNDALLSFGAKTGGSDVTARWLSLGKTTGANMIRCGPLALAGSARLFTAIAAGDLITIPNISGMALSTTPGAAGNEIIVLTPTMGLLPAGLTEGQNYFVKTISGNDITVSATSGGSAVDITAAGSGIIFTHIPLPITTTPSITPQIPIGALDVIAAF